MSFVAAAVISGGVALAAGAMSASAAGSAASAQANAANNAAALQAQSSKDQLALQREMYNQQRADIAPYRQAGLTAQNRLLSYLGLDPSQSGMAPVSTFDEAGYRKAMDAYNSGQGGVTGGPEGGRYLIEPGYFQESTQDSGGQTWVPAKYGTFSGGAGAGAAPMAMPTREQFTTNMPVDQLQVDPNDPSFGKYARDFNMTDFTEDPGYAFRINEGLKAVDRQAAARGGLISGAALKASQRYGQDMASQEYGNAFNRYQVNRSNQLNPLMSISGYGQQATNQLGQYGTNFASNASNTMGAGATAQGNSLMQAGNARASGYVGQANALNSALGGVSNIFGQYSAMQNNPYGGSYAPDQTVDLGVGNYSF